MYFVIIRIYTIIKKYVTIFWTIIVLIWLKILLFIVCNAESRTKWMVLFIQLTMTGDECVDFRMGVFFLFLRWTDWVHEDTYCDDNHSPFTRDIHCIHISHNRDSFFFSCCYLCFCFCSLFCRVVCDWNGRISQFKHQFGTDKNSTLIFQYMLSAHRM